MQLDDKAPLRVLIVGGGTAGWMTAAALSRLIPSAVARFTLVESEEIGTIGVGEATVPHIRFFNARLGFDEKDFMARTRATFKLGIEFRDWGRIGDSYIHPFGAFGEPIDGVDFHHHWMRARRSGSQPGLEAFSLPAMAARQERFMHPSEDPSSPLATFSYAYQFDAGLYASYLGAYARRLGVNRIEGRIEHVHQNGESGHIESVQLSDGRRIEADFFIDCSGFRALLIQSMEDTDFEDWSRWLPCDRALAAPCASSAALVPFTRATACPVGWRWRIPLQHRVGNGFVYPSAFCDEDNAIATLLEGMEAKPQADPKPLRFKAGKRRNQWVGNVVAIGLSAGFLEPLESTSIHLIQLAIGYLVDSFPDRDFDPDSQAEYNRIMALEYERIRDFLVLHYHATERDDSPFWNYCRTMQVPDSLAYRMDLFRERGLVPPYHEGMFLDASWLAVFFGQNVFPRMYDPRSDRLDGQELHARLARLLARHSEAVTAMPHHTEFLRSSGACPEPVERL